MSRPDGSEFDVAIVGGGIVGSYAAYHLAKTGHRVTLFEKGRIAGEQSSRNWGFVRLQGRDPAEIPMMLEGRRIWASLSGEIGTDIEWREGGNLVLAADEQRLSQFEEWLEHAKIYQVDSRIVTPQEAAAIVPGMSVPSLGGLYTPSDGQAEPEKAAPAIAAAARSLGANIEINCVVDGIEVENGVVRGLHTERGRVRAGSVILCAGAWTKYLLRGLRIGLPQLWMRGSVARTTAAKRAVTETGVWAGFSFRQRVDGTFNVAGGDRADHDLLLDSLLEGPAFRPLLDKHKGMVKVRFGYPFLDFLPARLSTKGLGAALRRHRALDPKPNMDALRTALSRLRDGVADIGDVRIERCWAGYIDCTPDFVPVLDRLDSPNGLVIATGLSGHGFGMGPITGQVAGDLAVGRSLGYDLNAFRLSRFHDGSAIVPRNVV